MSELSVLSLTGAASSPDEDSLGVEFSSGVVESFAPSLGGISDVLVSVGVEPSVSGGGGTLPSSPPFVPPEVVPDGGGVVGAVEVVFPGAAIASTADEAEPAYGSAETFPPNIALYSGRRSSAKISWGRTRE